MLSKKEIKDIQSLSHKKFREALKLFIAEGPKIVGELVTRVPGQVRMIYATTEWKNMQEQKITLPITEISEAELERISQLQTPNQVLALVEQFPVQAPVGEGLIIYLDRIQDPGNMGTIIRIADWFGVKEIVCSEGCADLYNPKVVQSSMASLARVSVFEEDGKWLSSQSMPVYAASLDGESVYTISKIEKGILVIGNESRGITQEILDRADTLVTIPRKGEAESLNAAVATGILLSHLLN
jgi:RNA methyltransferase, TrmH family